MSYGHTSDREMRTISVWSKEQEKEYKKQWYEAKKLDPEYVTKAKERRKLSDKKRYLTNKSQILSWSRDWKASNKDRIKEYRKQYWIKNQNKERKTHITWLIENSEEWKLKKRELDKEYALQNQAKIKLQRRLPETRHKINIRENKRYHNDIAYSLEKKLRAIFVQSLKAQNTKKTQSITALIGCTVDFLKQHLEQQFQSGMTWSNRGRFGWHIDHIKPCASFDLSDPDEQKKCFHYSNLQPLWWNENINKSARLDWIRPSNPIPPWELVPCAI